MKTVVTLLALAVGAVLFARETATGKMQACIRLESPYAFGQYQHKVQLHSHTTDSDGEHSPEWVLQAYQARGYVAVAKTDHDHAEWTPTLDDPGGHSIIHIPSVEYSGDDERRSFAHMLGINIRTIHHAAGSGNRQAQIDQAAREGGLTFVCHPYDVGIHRRGWSGEQVTTWIKDFTGMEIHNGGSYLDPQPGGRNYPYKVDLVLSTGARTFIIATDDFHRDAEQTMDRGYVVINSDKDERSITLDDIVAALRQGNFFAAGRVATNFLRPPHFHTISTSGDTIVVGTDVPTDIQFITNRHNYSLGEPWCSQLTRGVTGASYRVSPEDKWVRVKATVTDADGNQSHAWSNPIHVTAAPATVASAGQG